MRAGASYHCPQCGESAPVGVSCPRCDTPMVDEHGRTAPVEQIVPGFAPTRTELAEGIILILTATAAMIAGMTWAFTTEGRHHPILVGIECHAAVFVLASLAGRVRKRLSAVRRRERWSRLARVARGTVQPAPGLHGVRGRVRVLRAVRDGGEVPVAVSRRDGIVEAGRFVVEGERSAAVVDDDWLEILGYDGDFTIVDGELVDVVGPLGPEPVVPVPGVDAGLPVATYAGRPGAPIRLARPA